MNELQQAMDKTKVALLSSPDSAFFATIAFSLKNSWDTNIPTACTNGTTIKFNPEFFKKLTPQERVFLWIHEAMHVAYLHAARLKDREPRRWNMAADYVINLQLVDRGFRMPKDGLLDRQYAGMSTEQVYDLLTPSQAENFQMDLEEGEDKDLKEEIDDILMRAVMQSKMSGDKPGTIPGDIQIYVENLLNPKLPWNRLLQKYMNSFAKNDYSWRKPNRRFFPKFHMPCLHSDKLMDLAIAVDISGSVSDTDFKVFISETAGIMKMMTPEKITLIQFDTRICSETKITNLKELEKTEFSGRGGTSFYPIIDWVKAKRPQLLLVFTDGEFHMPDEKPKTEVLWLIHNNERFTCPYGKTIHYKI
jgi:predicted metal-dependent peptidase